MKKNVKIELTPTQVDVLTRIYASMWDDGWTRYYINRLEQILIKIEKAEQDEYDKGKATPLPRVLGNEKED